MSLKHILLNEALKSTKKATDVARSMTGPQIARSVLRLGPTKELAIMCGRAGVAGAAVDGAMGAFQAGKALYDGKTDKAGAAKHVLAEAGCGFVTSSVGTAGTLAAYMVTGTMGPVVLVAGMGASMGSRWAYRKVVGETLTEAQAAVKTEHTSNPEGFEEVGPEDPT